MEPRPIQELSIPTRPLYLVRVQAGFPSPAEDYLETNLNLHDYVVRRPSSTFFVRATGDSMAPGIAAGDLLVVDRSVQPQPLAVILAVVDGEFTVKRYQMERGRVMLLADNPSFAPIIIRDTERFQIWGVVTYVVHDPNR